MNALIITWIVVAISTATVLIGLMLGRHHAAARSLSVRDFSQPVLFAIAWPLILFVAVAVLLADAAHFLIEVVRKPH